jgi:hypothetical protein
MKPLQLRDRSRCSQYHRIGAISLQEGVKRIKAGGTQILFRVSVAFHGSRLQTYSEKGVTCVDCGRQGMYFAIEKPKTEPFKEKYHINVYGINKYGSHFMMTSDHIIPKSRGGSDDVGNRQPMCADCNNRKKDLMPGEKERSPKTEMYILYQKTVKTMRKAIEREGLLEAII